MVHGGRHRVQTSRPESSKGRSEWRNEKKCGRFNKGDGPEGVDDKGDGFCKTGWNVPTRESQELNFGGVFPKTLVGRINPREKGSLKVLDVPYRPNI